MPSPFALAFLMLFSATAFGADRSAAQDYPRKPIRIVTGEAGGGSDIAARQIGQGLNDSLGIPVVIDNRGGSVVIQAGLAGQAQSDGHTLLFASTPFWLLPFMQSNVPYDPLKDFMPITLATRASNVLVIHPGVAANTAKELIAVAKQSAQGLNYASTGTGSSTHLSAELFKAMAGVNLVRVGYKGSAPALADLISGQTQLMFITAVVATPQVKSGRLRALAVTSLKPSPLLPDLPTISSSGLAGYESAVLTGMFVRAGTPAPLVERINRETVRALNRTEVRERQLSAGGEVVASTPDEFTAVLKSEMAKWSKVIRDAGIRAE